MKVTIWLRFYPEQMCFKHNHYEEGWIDYRKGTPEGHETWSSYQWAKQYKHLKNNEII